MFFRGQDTCDDGWGAASHDCRRTARMTTVRRGDDYRSAPRLGDTVAKQPRNPRAHGNLGYELARQGFDDAMAQYGALRIDPTLPRRTTASVMRSSPLEGSRRPWLTTRRRCGSSRGASRAQLSRQGAGRPGTARGHGPLCEALQLNLNPAWRTQPRQRVGRPGKLDEAGATTRKRDGSTPSLSSCKPSTEMAGRQGSSRRPSPILGSAGMNPHDAGVRSSLGIVLFRQETEALSR